MFVFEEMYICVCIFSHVIRPQLFCLYQGTRKFIHESILTVDVKYAMDSATVRSITLRLGVPGWGSDCLIEGGRYLESN